MLSYFKDEEDFSNGRSPIQKLNLTGTVYAYITMNTVWDRYSVRMCNKITVCKLSVRGGGGCDVCVCVCVRV